MNLVRVRTRAARPRDRARGSPACRSGTGRRPGHLIREAIRFGDEGLEVRDPPPAPYWPLRSDRQRGASPGIPVELGEGRTRVVSISRMKACACTTAVPDPSSRCTRHEDVVRSFTASFTVPALAVSSPSVDDHHVEPLTARVLHRALRDLHRVLAVGCCYFTSFAHISSVDSFVASFFLRLVQDSGAVSPFERAWPTRWTLTIMIMPVSQPEPTATACPPPLIVACSSSSAAWGLLPITCCAG